MHIFDSINAPVEKITDTITRQYGISLYLKREDLNHPEIMGNKLRKLKYNLIAAKKGNASSILSFGGAYSNHILALSAAGRIFNIPTIGIIRGDELKTKKLNPILAKAHDNGMQLHFITRQDYREKDTIEFTASLHDKFDQFYLLPEGGSNKLAVKGVAEIIADLDDDYDVILCACGTGGTIAGLISGAVTQHKTNLNIIGFQVVNAKDFVQHKIKELLPHNIHNCINWTINTDFHFGGYAKTNEKLITFIQWFKTTHNIDLDYIYTGKMMFGLYQLIQSSYFKQGMRLLAIHTGGTQTAAVANA